MTISSHQNFQAMELTIIYLWSLPQKCTPAVDTNTVGYLPLLIPFTGVSCLQDKALLPHTIPLDKPTAFIPCAGQRSQEAQAPNSEQCFLQPSAISHQLQFPSTTTATARTSPWDGCCRCPASLEFHWKQRAATWSRYGEQWSCFHRSAKSL